MSQLDVKERESLLLDLLSRNELDAGRRVLDREPQLWWRAFDLEVERVSATPRDLRSSSERLRGLVDPSQWDALGSIPNPPASNEALRLLATTLPPSIGLWRQAGWQQWVEAARDLTAIKPEGLRLRALIVLLLPTEQADTPPARRRLWLAAFAPLHHALTRKKLSSADWEALDAFLPSRALNDGAERLRRAVVAAIVRDRWPPDQAQRAVDGAHPFEQQMLSALRAKQKKPKGWFRELVEELIP